MEFLARSMRERELGLHVLRHRQPAFEEWLARGRLVHGQAGANSACPRQWCSSSRSWDEVPFFTKVVERALLDEGVDGSLLDERGRGALLRELVDLPAGL